MTFRLANLLTNDRPPITPGASNDPSRLYAPKRGQTIPRAVPRRGAGDGAMRDGTPASTACWYELQDSRVLITMYATARRLPNIHSTPHVAMTILGEDSYQHVSISGPVIKTWDDPELEVMDGLSMRNTGERGRDETRVSAHWLRSNGGTPTRALGILGLQLR